MIKLYFCIKRQFFLADLQNFEEFPFKMKEFQIQTFL
jgi:hypothetical protein